MEEGKKENKSQRWCMPSRKQRFQIQQGRYTYELTEGGMHKACTSSGWANSQHGGGEEA